MAHSKFRLVSRGRPVVLSNTRIVKFFNLATDDTKAEVIAAGYFNDSRADLTVNSVIDFVYDCDGSPGFARARVTAVPATGNVTVSEIV